MTPLFMMILKAAAPAMADAMVRKVVTSSGNQRDRQMLRIVETAATLNNVVGRVRGMASQSKNAQLRGSLARHEASLDELRGKTDKLLDEAREAQRAS